MIDILLATYNGGTYLEAQIQSLLTQDFTNWKLLILDDHSTDNTVSFIQRLAKEWPEKIRFQGTHSQNLGVIHTFDELIKQSTSPYSMLCDQDDVWLPSKINITLRQMQALERQYGPQTPLLVHTDLKLVRQDLSEICSSFWRYQGLGKSQQAHRLQQLLVRNVVTGCTVMINRPLRQRCLSIATDAFMHDWWLALVAVEFGVVSYLPEATVLYRQHSRNAVGARSQYWGYSLEKLRRIDTVKTYYDKTFRQASAFLSYYDNSLSPQARKLIADYLTLQPVWALPKRLRSLLWNQHADIGCLRNLAFLLLA